ncbi:IS110 family transposase [Alteromonas sp. 5E99-2]|uniref:IS110 family transposase n=1 Tax=Alteromonas sp. 5E99-2 TaxID=2817683 RepID=UPI001A999A0F|nr:IS110 family transposase [Alteromonas sp. 5E99-2]MBO1256334.1 IS110 family transposase [Alteromonas sp. 5E99-2]
MKKRIIGVDLALNSIQVCKYTNNKVHSNSEMTPSKFTDFLANLTASTIIFESCSGAHYWCQLAKSLGHEALLISPRLVMAVRQNQKTDKNDALAIIQAALLPDVKFVAGKNHQQQQIQSMLKLREQCIKQKTAIKNQLTSLCREFNIRPGRSKECLISTIEFVLEDAENGFSFEFRKMLQSSLALYLCLHETIESYDHALEKWVNDTPDCAKLMKIEGIGILNALHLYINLLSGELGHFKQGKDASACIGLMPVQYSTGGKVRLGAIGKRKSTSLRSLLITGAMSVVQQVVKREARTKKEAWLKALIERRGKKCAAVALANKNVRTAFALMTNKTEYKLELM